MNLKKYFGIAALIGFTILLLTGYLAYASYNKLEQAKAIEDAKEYKPQPYDECLMGVQVTVDAIHEKTGAHYTFPNGCMPDGWKPKN